MNSEPVQDFELDAYLDNELDLRRRIAVEDHLARNPDAAARVMADMRTQSTLRLLAELRSEPARPLTDAGKALSRKLATRGWARRWLPSLTSVTAMAAALTLVVVAIVPNRTATAALPSYVSDAVMSYHTGLLRAAMASQVETLTFDQTEIRDRTQIRVPRLPAGWRVTDVQIFPSDDGPALQIMIHTPAGKDVSIFAVRAQTAAPPTPVAIRHGNSSVAYWRHGDISYALTGAEAPEALDLAATDLAAQPTD